MRTFSSGTSVCSKPRCHSAGPCFRACGIKARFLAEARQDAAHAPTAMYFGGGPGYTSLDSMSVFPCKINADSNSTTLNPLSWNNKVNMLYVEQPAGVGYSYSKIQNGTWNAVIGPNTTSHFTPLPAGVPPPTTNVTTVAASLDPLVTLNTTAQAARIIWQFAQIFFQEYVSELTRPTIEC